VPHRLFFHFESPHPAVWFYAAFALAVAVFFQFQRLLVLRNLDLLALLFFAPGFLLIADGTGDSGIAFLGYAWLLGVSGFWFVRCLLDVTAVKRPRVAVNLGTPALFWIAGALLVGLIADAGSKIAVIDSVGIAQTAEPKLIVSRGIAIGCQIAVAVLLLLIGWIHFREAATGAGAAALYLMLPFTSYRFDHSHHVWPTALLLGAFLGYRKPVAAGILFGIAVGTSFFPIVLLPVWWQFYRGRGQGTFLLWFASFTIISLAVTVPALIFGGEYTSGIWQTLYLGDWQPWRSVKLDGIWAGVHWAYRLPVFIAFAAFAFGSFFWPTARDFGQLLAANSVLLIGIQFWFADRGGEYVLWYAPLLILMILRPTTTEMQPPTRNHKTLFGWLRRRRAPNVGAAPSLAV